MRYLGLAVIGILLCGSAFAMDITIKDLPDDINVNGYVGEEGVKKWVDILVVRSENAKVDAEVKKSPAVVAVLTGANENITAYRVNNGLVTELVAEVVVEPKIEG